MDDEIVSWVDIDTNELFVLTASQQVEQHILPLKPSVVLHHENASLIIGCELGLYRFGLSDHSWQRITAFPEKYDAAQFRSNDGCRLEDGRYLLGTMHRECPDTVAGEVYVFDGSNPGRALGFPTHIPNGFVPLPRQNILIADSSSGVIHRLNLEKQHRQADASKWNSERSGVGTPDGACFLPDGSILFAYWGAGKLVQFCMDGHVVDEIPIPVRKPSNCKYRRVDNRLYITSSSHGLESASSPNTSCGHTLSCEVGLDG